MWNEKQQSSSYELKFFFKKIQKIIQISSAPKGANRKEFTKGKGKTIPLSEVPREFYSGQRTAST